MCGTEEGPVDFAPHPLLPNQYLEQLHLRSLKEIQANCRQAISSEPCTRSGIEDDSSSLNEMVWELKDKMNSQGLFSPFCPL